MIWVFASLLPVIAIIWLHRELWAMRKAAHQREAMLGAIRELSHNPIPLLRQLSDVSLEDHSLWIFWGRDPEELYSHELRFFLSSVHS